MAGDLLAVLDHVGWETALCGGTSLGAATMLVLARRHPQRARGLIQDLPGFGPASARGAESADRVAVALADTDLQAAARLAGSALPASRARAVASVLLDQWKPFPAADLGPKLARAFRASARWRIVKPQWKMRWTRPRRGKWGCRSNFGSPLHNH